MGPVRADRARVAGKLVQLRIDGSPLPMPFDRIQCADLAGWSGEPEARDWKKVVESVAELIQGRPVEDAAMPALPAARASVAVMPFANLSDDPEQAYFAEGMVEEVVSVLARFKSIFVIAAGSSMVIRGRAAAPQEAARQLGVRYILEGSVRRAAGRVRIALHLVDAATGAEVWSDRLEDTLEDVYA
jgi:adenylate cyclase